VGTSKRVLLIDDEQPILELFSAALAKRGHTFDTAENGRIGFRKATSDEYDLIICDLHMPEWDGIDSIKGISMVKPHSRFLVVSGYAENVVADEVRNLENVLAVLMKPVDLSKLIQYVESS